MGAGGQRHAPAALPPGKTRYLFYRSVGGFYLKVKVKVTLEQSTKAQTGSKSTALIFL